MIYEIMVILIIILLFIMYYFNYFFEYYENNIDTNNVNIDKYKYIMLNNNKKDLYKIGLSKDISIYSEDCSEKCDATKCTMLNERTKSLNKCIQCNSQKYKCFKNDIRTITGGSCEDCNIENINDKLDCFSTENYGCPSPNDLNSINGVKPYYIQLNDNSPVSPYNEKCVFCNNILDNL
jgi:hypothetical protein